jgi:hypothetical protein
MLICPVDFVDPVAILSDAEVSYLEKYKKKMR